MKNNRLKWLISDKKQNRMWQHALFWLFSFVLLVRIFAFENNIQKSDLIFTLIFHISLVVLVYSNLRFGIPQLLAKGKNLLYVCFAVAVVFLCALLNIFSFEFLVDLIFPGYFFISEYNVFEASGFMVVYLSISSLLKLSKAWFQVAEARETMEKLQREKTDAELRALKAQVNPHFLFNSLNSLYSLALYKDEKTPELILRLSNAMRYMLYESNGQMVRLEDELAYLDNFVELQKLRSDEAADIRFERNGTPGDLEIAPLLLIPFIENGFKHGIKGDDSEPFIYISIQIVESKLILKVTNNKGVTDIMDDPKYKGIGLENVKRRLKLLYNSRFDLKIDDGEKKFGIQLNLELK